VKAAIPILSDRMDAKISLRFARSPYLAIIDTATSEYEIIENAYHKMNTGAGRSIIEFLVTMKHVKAIIAFEMGLNVQQKAIQKKLQLIILDNKDYTLQRLLKMFENNRK
jgi:predicted Fe-Mo cluster-binding NifX family protein